MISSLAGIGIFEIFSFPPPLKPPNPPSSRKPPAPAPMLLIADVKPLLVPFALAFLIVLASRRSEEHTSELQSLMRISYAVFCLKKKKHTHHITRLHLPKSYHLNPIQD